MNNDIWIIDAFTPVPFKGNAAAVCVLEQFLPDSSLQRIAAIMNLSETAFLVKKSPLHYDLRWFTPEIEVALCGHATLAATHRLRQSSEMKNGDTVTYHTLSGELRARVHDKIITLDFPALPGVPAKAPAALNALGVDILACQRNAENYLVEVRDFKTLRACTPNFKKLTKMGAQGVIITTATGVEGFDFASRYFAPAIGIDEDPATGSAHCFLGPYWAKTLGKTQFHALQASRGHGIFDVSLAGDRALISGQAVTTLKCPIPPLTKDKAA